jgi:hypothetical protein
MIVQRAWQACFTPEILHVIAGNATRLVKHDLEPSATLQRGHCETVGDFRAYIAD